MIIPSDEMSSSLVAFILKTLKNEEIVEAGEREVSRALLGLLVSLKLVIAYYSFAIFTRAPLNSMVQLKSNVNFQFLAFFMQ